MNDLFKSFERVRNSATALAVSPDSERQQALRRIADSLNENKDRIFAESSSGENILSTMGYLSMTM